MALNPLDRSFHFKNNDPNTVTQHTVCGKAEWWMTFAKLKHNELDTLTA